MWLNSSLGLLLMIAHRVPTRGPWVSFKKPSLEAVAVLDVRALSDDQLNEFDLAFEGLSAGTLKPISEIATDETRGRIDAAIARILGLPDLRPLAEMLGREPVITNVSLAAPTEESRPIQMPEHMDLL